jgi:cytochrome oxidase Cu insertion factor (SCO1/SenC/PrrC family)
LASVFALPAVAQRQRNADRPNRTPDKLAEGDAAPDFTLKSLDGKTTTKLSSFRGKKPVALVFGSYT